FGLGEGVCLDGGSLRCAARDRAAAAEALVRRGCARCTWGLAGAAAVRVGSRASGGISGSTALRTGREPSDEPANSGSCMLGRSARNVYVRDTRPVQPALNVTVTTGSSTGTPERTLTLALPAVPRE